MITRGKREVGWAPESTRRLPNRYLDWGNEDLSVAAARDFFFAGGFERVCQRLDEIRPSFFNGRALTCDIKLRAEGDEAFVFALDESR